MLHYDHQTWKDGDIPWESPKHKFIQSIDQVVLQVHMTDKNLCISTTRVPMTTEPSSMIIYLDGFQPK